MFKRKKKKIDVQTSEFIKRRRTDQTLKSKSTQSLYELYMEERNDD